MPEYLVSRDRFDRPVPRQPAYFPHSIKLNLVLTYGIPPTFRDGVHIYRQPPLGQSRVYRVTQLRTDGVHCRESTNTGPGVLKIVPERVSSCLSRFHNGLFFLGASLFPHPLYKVRNRHACVIKNVSCLRIGTHLMLVAYCSATLRPQCISQFK